jgi:hypothetical protein
VSLRQHPTSESPGSITPAAVLLVLLLSQPAYAFPLTMGLGNAGVREFHFCQLDVTLRSKPCADAPDCLEFATDGGPVWLDVHRTASLSEAAAGTALLGDMFQYTHRLSMVGDPTLLARLRLHDNRGALELHGFWYPSGRRLLLIEVLPADSR